MWNLYSGFHPVCLNCCSVRVAPTVDLKKECAISQSLIFTALRQIGRKLLYCGGSGTHTFMSTKSSPRPHGQPCKVQRNNNQRGTHIQPPLRILHATQSGVHAQGERGGRPLLGPVGEGPVRRLYRIEERPPRRQERRRRGKVQEGPTASKTGNLSTG